MLEISGLTVKVEEKVIVQDLNLVLGAGQVEALMGPNGSGKSTLAAALAGHPAYSIESGSVKIDGQEILDLEPHERSHAGLFLAFQYPIEIPGITFLSFLKEIVNAKRKSLGQSLVDAGQFILEVKEHIQKVGLDESFLYRQLNDGFSGGEKKRAEILQMLLLEPKVVILDETDSGLDIDALRSIAASVRSVADAKTTFLVITHYQRLLEYLQPDKVHIFSRGSVIKSGDMELAFQLERDGYAQFL